MANKAIYQRVVQDATGSIVPSAQYEVFDEGSGLNATIYSDRAGTTPITQPAFADTSGIIQFFIDPGITFRAEVTGGSGAYNDRYQQGLLLTDSATDTDSDRVTKVGDFGLGTEVNSTAYTDADSIVLGESGYVGAGGSNTPDSAEGWIIECNVGPLATIKEQKATSVSSTRYEMRYMFGGIWSSWQELYHTGNLLGAVSESSGVPTGAVIERGSNANGEYTKFADGTLICFIPSRTESSQLVTTANTTYGYRSPEISYSFPASFIDTSIAVNPSNLELIWPDTVAYRTSSSTYKVFGVSQTSITSNYVYSIIAIGRWF